MPTQIKINKHTLAELHRKMRKTFKVPKRGKIVAMHVNGETTKFDPPIPIKAGDRIAYKLPRKKKEKAK